MTSILSYSSGSLFQWSFSTLQTAWSFVVNRKRNAFKWSRKDLEWEKSCFKQVGLISNVNLCWLCFANMWVLQCVRLCCRRHADFPFLLYPLNKIEKILTIIGEVRQFIPKFYNSDLREFFSVFQSYSLEFTWKPPSLQCWYLCIA